MNTGTFNPKVAFSRGNAFTLKLQIVYSNPDTYISSYGEQVTFQGSR